MMPKPCHSLDAWKLIIISNIHTLSGPINNKFNNLQNKYLMWGKTSCINCNKVSQGKEAHHHSFDYLPAYANDIKQALF